MNGDHRETEHALARAETALSDAQQALSCIVDTDELESDAGAHADDLRDILRDAQEVYDNGVQGLADGLSELISRLETACTDASELYNRL